jgi:hypothetical protein
VLRSPLPNEFLLKKYSRKSIIGEILEALPYDPRSIVENRLRKLLVELARPLRPGARIS